MNEVDPLDLTCVERGWRYARLEDDALAAWLRREQPAGRGTREARRRARTRSESRVVGTGRRITGSVRTARGQGSVVPR